MYKTDRVSFKCPTRLPFQSDKPVYIVTMLTLNLLEYYPDFNLQNESFASDPSDHHVRPQKGFRWAMENI